MSEQVLTSAEHPFGILQKGDSRIEKAYTKAIILVGLTRVGKSTTYNWILDKKMIGAGTKIRPYYVNVIAHDSEQAIIKQSIVSVTLCPNISEYSKDQKICLIDMAGYQDKRNYVGVYGVSYFLKSVFERVNQAKFVIVIDEENLTLGSGDGITKTLSGFLNMFDLQEINKIPQIKAKFLQSISLCVTKSVKPELHQDYLRDICDQMKNETTLVTDKKAQIIELVQYLLDKSNLIDQFKKARYNDHAEPCKIIETYNKKEWSFFNIKSSYIKLPFQKQFENLPPSQQKQFEEVINKRLRSYLQFSKILKTLIQSVNSKWAVILQQWRQKGILDLKFTYQEMFEQIDQFLAQNDLYKSQEFIKPEFKIDYNELNLVNIIQTILELFKITEQTADLDGAFQQNMVKYSVLFAKICEKLKLFCSSKEEEQKICRLKFIIERGFKEFSKLYQIKPELVSDANQQMKDNCNQVFDEKKNKFIERYVKQINYEVLIKMFDKLQGLQQYQIFFETFEKDYKDHSQCTFTGFKQHRRYIEICRANIHEKNQNQRAALKSHLKVLKILGEIGYQIQQSPGKNLDEVDTQLNDFFMQKLTSLGFIINILKKLPSSPNAKTYALALCIHVKDINRACQIYELLLTQAAPVERKIQLIGQYFEYCLKWGRFSKANDLLQLKLSCEVKNYLSYKQTKEKLIDLNKNLKKNALMDDYLKNLEELGRIDQKDSDFECLLEGIQCMIE